MIAWNKGKIGDVCRVVPGYAFKSSDWQDKGIPVVKIKNITRDNSVDLTTTDCVPRSLLTPKLQKFVISDGDILVAMTGATAGKVGRVRTNHPLLLNQRVAKIAPFNADSKFIWAVVSSQEYQEKFFYLADGAAQPNMSGNQIEGVEIPLPPLPIQRRIAGILSAYDELIENSQRRIKILESMSRALYREWFVHFRFPGHESVPLVPSPLGGIPQGWEVRKVAEFADFTRGFEPGSNAYKKDPGVGLVKFLRVGDLSKRDSGLFIDENLVQGRVLRPLDIAITLDGSVGEVRLGLEGAYSSGIRRVDVKDRSRLGWIFTYQLLLSDASQATIQAHAKGTTIKHAGSAVAALVFVSPPETAIKEFETIASPMMRQALSLQEQVENLRRTRDLLLPRLLSGQLEL